MLSSALDKVPPHRSLQLRTRKKEFPQNREASAKFLYVSASIFALFVNSHPQALQPKKGSLSLLEGSVTPVPLHQGCAICLMLQGWGITTRMENPRKNSKPSQNCSDIGILWTL